MQIAFKMRGYFNGVLYMKKERKNGKGQRRNSTRKGFYMFSRDLLSSQRYRRCSWVAKGVYCDLLNVLALQPRAGAISLSDFDLRPKNERSLTFRCLQCQKKAKSGEYKSITYFAEAIAVAGASGPRPGLIHGLQELYLRGMIIIEGDTLIQPRMYIDNGFELTDEDGNPRPLTDDGVTVAGSPDDAPMDKDAALERMQNSDDFDTENSAENDAENITKKTRVGARDARAQSKRVGGRVINNIDNNDNKGNIGGTGDAAATEMKTEENNPAGGKDPSKREKSPETINSTPGAQKPVSEPKNNKDGVSVDGDAAAKIVNRKSVNRKSSVADNPPTLEDIQAYMDERAQQGKPFVYVTAEGFLDACEQSGWTLKDGKPIRDWRARLRTFETYRKEHGDRPVAQRQGGGQTVTPLTSPKPGDPIPATKPSKGKYKNKW